MQQKELATLLDISPAMVCRLVKKGMPTDTVERAERWRKRHLEPGRMKGNRYAPNRTPPEPQRQATHNPCSFATGLMEIASMALESGQSIVAMIPDLRAALHAVPPPERDDVGLHGEVMDVLVAHVRALLPQGRDALNDDGSPVWCDGGSMTDDEAQEMGEFWYQVAAGEWVVRAEISKVLPGVTGRG